MLYYPSYFTRSNTIDPFSQLAASHHTQVNLTMPEHLDSLTTLPTLITLNNLSPSLQSSLLPPHTIQVIESYPIRPIPISSQDISIAFFAPLIKPIKVHWMPLVDALIDIIYSKAAHSSSPLLELCCSHMPNIVHCYQLFPLQIS